MRYGWPIKNVPAKCSCGKQFTITHALSCHRGGFTSIRHNELRNLTADMLQHVCHDVQIEPPLEPLTGEHFRLRSTNRADEARLDVSARGFWNAHQKAFVDVRVINPLAMRHQNQSPMQILDLNANEKKRQYCRRVLEVENATFTPLVFTTNGAMGRECVAFYNRIAMLLSQKWDIHHSKVTAWVRARLSFALVRATGVAIRGSRKWQKRVTTTVADDVKTADIGQ